MGGMRARGDCIYDRRVNKGEEIPLSTTSYRSGAYRVDLAVVMMSADLPLAMFG